MYVVTIDTFLIVGYIIVDTETHHIHDQTYQHQQKWNNHFCNQHHETYLLLFCNCYRSTFQNKTCCNSEVIVYKKCFSAFTPRNFTTKVPTNSLTCCGRSDTYGCPEIVLSLTAIVTGRLLYYIMGMRRPGFCIVNRAGRMGSLS